jgi:hypothetical protein
MVARQTALAHCVPVMQGCPVASLHAPTPLQALTPVHAFAGLVSGCPVAMFEQIPGAAGRLQAMHAVVHVRLQHTPSVQAPLAQSAATAQACPLAFLQAPTPLQVLGARHGIVALASDVPRPRFAHVPSEPAMLHAMHVPEQVVPQQMPSTQLPLAQLAATAHTEPLIFLQTPAPLHVLGALHVPGSDAPTATLVHVPIAPGRLQATHPPPHVVLQQTPSVQ